MNVHHLELFYYVAKYEGITAAVRKMPYGIQQPAVSGQILQLENELGVKLFNRRPFALTKAGEDLYDFAYPFFSRLADIEERLKGEESSHLRIAASASVLGNHLPEVLEKLKLKTPDLKLTLKEVEPSEVFGLLTSQQADVAVTVLHDRLSDGLKSVELMRIPLALAVPASCNVSSLEDLLDDSPYGDGKIGKIPLVGLPANETLQRLFQQGLNQLSVRWEVSMEVNALDVIQRYVGRGFGAGITVAIPGVSLHQGCQLLPLDGFPPLVIGAVYQGSLKPITLEFLEAAKKHVASLVS